MITLDTDDVIEVSDYIGALMMSRKLREPFSRQVSNYDSMASSYEIGEVPSSDSHFGLNGDVMSSSPSSENAEKRIVCTLKNKEVYSHSLMVALISACGPRSMGGRL